MITNLIKPPIVLHAQRRVSAQPEPPGTGYDGKKKKRAQRNFFREGNSVWPRQVVDGPVNNGGSVDLIRRAGSI